MNYKITLSIIFSFYSFSLVCQEKFNKKLVNKNSLLFANEIAEGSMVQSNTVGIGGVKPQQSYCFDSLCYYSSEQELIELTNHTDAKVRCYAFDGLLSLESKSIGSVIRKNESDTAIIFYQDGCIVSSHTVISQMVLSISQRQLSKIDFRDQKLIVKLRNKYSYYEMK